MILHYILQHKLDICFITETLISRNEDLQYIKANLMTQGFNILSFERKNRKGGGLACIYNERFKMKLLVPENYESFESLTVQCNIKSRCYVRQCSLLFSIALNFFKCLGFHMHYISLYGALSPHNCLSSGSLVFAHLGIINKITH